MPLNPDTPGFTRIETLDDHGVPVFVTYQPEASRINSALRRAPFVRREPHGGTFLIVVMLAVAITIVVAALLLMAS